MKNMRLVWNGQDIKVEEAEKHILEILLREEEISTGIRCWPFWCLFKLKQN